MWGVRKSCMLATGGYLVNFKNGDCENQISTRND